MSRVIQIAQRKIGPDFPPFVIAEMSANHNGSIDTALSLITAAKKAGSSEKLSSGPP